MAKPAIDEQTLLDELADAFADVEIPEGAVTVKQLAQEIRKSYATCYNILEKLVQEKKLGKVTIRHTAYYFKIGRDR